MGMKKWFAHKMKIEKFNFSLQTICKYIKFFERHKTLFSSGFWTEETIKIANVGYFKIATGYHLCFIIYCLSFIENISIMQFYIRYCR